MEQLERLKPTLEQNDVAYAGVFGSVARGEATETSDVDILIKFEKPKSLLDLVRLERELSGTLGRDVDLVTEASLSPYIRDEVLRQLRVFYGAR
jgi:predicted nucleotidyltransferase